MASQAAGSWDMTRVSRLSFKPRKQMTYSSFRLEFDTLCPNFKTGLKVRVVGNDPNHEAPEPSTGFALERRDGCDLSTCDKLEDQGWQGPLIWLLTTTSKTPVCGSSEPSRRLWDMRRRWLWSATRWAFGTVRTGALSDGRAMPCRQEHQRKVDAAAPLAAQEACNNDEKCGGLYDKGASAWCWHFSAWQNGAGVCA